MLYRMLTNPMYGGAYAYGKTEHTLEYDHGEPRTGRRRRPREEWLALIPHAHEGYVSWDEFERIQQAMAANVRGWGAHRCRHEADRRCWPACCAVDAVGAS